MAPAERAPPTERPEFALAMRLHNEGEYYEAHEAWEQIWTDELDDEWRLFVQGLIQVTSAFHKLFVQREPRGAARLLDRGLSKLDKYPAEYLGISLATFREGARACLAPMADLVPKSPEIEKFDRTLVPRLVRLPQTSS
jgi:predicted metal-dependent hydrolase